VKINRRVVRHYRDAPNDFSQLLFAALPRRYNLLSQVLSMGQDRRWRRAMIDRVSASEPRLILDVACGPAAVTRALARRTNARVIGLDLSAPMLEQGRAVLEHARLTDRTNLVRGRAEELPFPDATFDAVTFTYLLRYVQDPAATLRELTRVLKPGAPMASLEFAVPPRVVWHVAWLFYTRVLLPVAGAATGGRAWYDAGRFLGPSISRHYHRYSIDWTTDAWWRAGMDHVEARLMSLGGGVVISGYRRGEP
jgi:demethylmenaquinone methyltransferase/2-methoxy-6-polyprenyl-1,4-benzoquinol methylase